MTLLLIVFYVSIKCLQKPSTLHSEPLEAVDSHWTSSDFLFLFYGLVWFKFCSICFCYLFIFGFESGSHVA